jgi:hypothetical protein
MVIKVSVFKKFVRFYLVWFSLVFGCLEKVYKFG